MEAKDRYDCIECGQHNCVTVVQNAGFCNTDGCVMNNPIQFVFYPNWKKPKTSRAEREIWWDPHYPYEQSTLPQAKILRGPSSLMHQTPAHQSRSFIGPK